jgi:capsular polysaccharide biosynthesis protein
VRAPWWSAVLAATLVGAGIGAAVAATGSVRYKAEAKVVVQTRGGPSVVRPLLPNLRELATSSLLAGNVDSTLRLPGTPADLQNRLRASIPPSSEVIVLSVSDSKSDRARQIAQESAVVLTQLVQARFRTPPLTAAILDPAHVVSRHGRRFLLDALIGAAVGLAVAAAALAAMRRGVVPAPAPSDWKLAARERKLEQRIALVTRRERELAKRAGELAKREQALQNHEPAVPPPAPTLEPEPAAAVAPALPASIARNGWTLEHLERLVRDQGGAFPERAAEWDAYLFYLRDYTEADGRLPENFRPLVEDVFGQLLG